MKNLGFIMIGFLVTATILLNCAGSDQFKARDLNACSGIEDNQKAIQKIQAQEKELYENMNDQNKKELTAQIENLENQIKGINASSASEMEHCEPTHIENPDK